MNPTPHSDPQPMLPFQAGLGAAPDAGSPGRLLANKDRLFRWCLAALVISATANLLALVLLATAAGTRPWFVTLDPVGNPYVAQGQRFEQARQLHAQQSIDAATALLYRTQQDFDFPERLSDLFAPAARDTAIRLKNSEAQEFQDKSLSQKAHIGRVEALDTRPDRVRVLVSGRLVRAGMFHQRLFVEELPFSLHLTLRHNPDLVRQARFPCLVEDFELRYGKSP